ncbi:MFS transporter [Desulfovibrio sp. OH1186_COT-070]|nr:MFS transporter [Desulfovibrio sp. OH1209_COT-279]RRD88288.1 MFS transporter [Desulfovibrio sp. OH1186_COT-070]
MRNIFSRKPFSLWALIASLYTTQFLGLSFFSVALVAILREQGASLEQVGSLYLIGMIGACRFLWAPLVDRVRFSPRIGHFRGWLLLMQGLLVMVLCFMASLDVAVDFSTIYLLCIIMAICGATQDIATDGLVCSLLAREERGIGNGIQTAGGFFGFMIGAGLVLMVYPDLGWGKAVMILAAGTMFTLVQVFLLNENKFQSKIQYRAKDEPAWRAAARLINFWAQPHAVRWVAMLLLFPAGITLASSLLTPALVDSRWSLEQIGLTVNILGSALGVVSSLAAGWMISRLGRGAVMPYCIIMQVLSICAVLTITSAHTSKPVVIAATLVHFWGYVPSVTMLTTLMMDNTSAASPSTDYTVQFSLYQFFSMGLAGLGMGMAGRVGYNSMLYVAIALALLAGVIAKFYLAAGGPRNRRNLYASLKCPSGAGAYGTAEQQKEKGMSCCR